jgi:hypothetical protein
MEIKFHFILWCTEGLRKKKTLFFKVVIDSLIFKLPLSSSEIRKSFLGLVKWLRVPAYQV